MSQPTASTVREWKYCLAGQLRESGTRYEVRCPWDQAVVGLVHRAGPEALEKATQAAVAAFETTRRLPSHRRKAILRAVEAGLTTRAEEFAHTLAVHRNGIPNYYN